MSSIFQPLKDEVINRPLLCGQSADDIVTAASPTSSPSTALVETRTNHAHTHDSGKKQYSGELKGANNFSGLLNLSEEQKKGKELASDHNGTTPPPGHNLGGHWE